MRLLPPSVVVALSLIGTVAHSQEVCDPSEVVQVPDDTAGEVVIDQGPGECLQAYVHQEGSNHAALVAQAGADQLASVVQLGMLGQAWIDQGVSNTGDGDLGYLLDSAFSSFGVELPTPSTESSGNTTTLWQDSSAGQVLVARQLGQGNRVWAEESGDLQVSGIYQGPISVNDVSDAAEYLFEGIVEPAVDNLAVIQQGGHPLRGEGPPTGNNVLGQSGAGNTTQVAQWSLGPNEGDPPAVPQGQLGATPYHVLYSMAVNPQVNLLTGAPGFGDGNTVRSTQIGIDLGETQALALGSGNLLTVDQAPRCAALACPEVDLLLPPGDPANQCTPLPSTCGDGPADTEWITRFGAIVAAGDGNTASLTQRGGDSSTVVGAVFGSGNTMSLTDNGQDNLLTGLATGANLLEATISPMTGSQFEMDYSGTANLGLGFLSLDQTRVSMSDAGEGNVGILLATPLPELLLPGAEPLPVPVAPAPRVGLPLACGEGMKAEGMVGDLQLDSAGFGSVYTGVFFGTGHYADIYNIADGGILTFGTAGLYAEPDGTEDFSGFAGDYGRHVLRNSGADSSLSAFAGGYDNVVCVDNTGAEADVTVQALEGDGQTVSVANEGDSTRVLATAYGDGAWADVTTSGLDNEIVAWIGRDPMGFTLAIWGTNTPDNRVTADIHGDYSRWTVGALGASNELSLTALEGADGGAYAFGQDNQASFTTQGFSLYGLVFDNFHASPEPVFDNTVTAAFGLESHAQVHVGSDGNTVNWNDTGVMNNAGIEIWDADADDVGGLGGNVVSFEDGGSANETTIDIEGFGNRFEGKRLGGGEMSFVSVEMEGGNRNTLTYEETGSGGHDLALEVGDGQDSRLDTWISGSAYEGQVEMEGTFNLGELRLNGEASDFDLDVGGDRNTVRLTDGGVDGNEVGMRVDGDDNQVSSDTTGARSEVDVTVDGERNWVAVLGTFIDTPEFDFEINGDDNQVTSDTTSTRSGVEVAVEGDRNWVELLGTSIDTPEFEVEIDGSDNLLTSDLQCTGACELYLMGDYNTLHAVRRGGGTQLEGEVEGNDNSVTFDVTGAGEQEIFVTGDGNTLDALRVFGDTHGLLEILGNDNTLILEDMGVGNPREIQLVRWEFPGETDEGLQLPSTGNEVSLSFGGDNAELILDLRSDHNCVELVTQPPREGQPTGATGQFVFQTNVPNAHLSITSDSVGGYTGAGVARLDPNGGDVEADSLQTTNCDGGYAISANERTFTQVSGDHFDSMVGVSGKVGATVNQFLLTDPICYEVTLDADVTPDEGQEVLIYAGMFDSLVSPEAPLAGVYQTVTEPTSISKTWAGQYLPGDEGAPLSVIQAFYADGGSATGQLQVQFFPLAKESFLVDVHPSVNVFSNGLIPVTLYGTTGRCGAHLVEDLENITFMGAPVAKLQYQDANRDGVAESVKLFFSNTEIAACADPVLEADYLGVPVTLSDPDGVKLIYGANSTRADHCLGE